jgi:twinkle protein
MITAKEISERLARQAEAVVQRLLPQGKREGREWVVGSVQGEPGQSLKVVLAGEKAGTWRDFAADHGGDLLDLWAMVRGISVADAMSQAREYLGFATPAFTGPSRRQYRRPNRPAAIRPKARVLNYLHSRGLTDDAIAAYKVGSNDNDTEIIFPFLRAGELVNVKYLRVERPDEKKVIRQEKDAEPCLFGWQAIPDTARSVVIAEGEIDAMTWWQMGFPALSVWSGAGNLQWVENEWDRLACFDTIYVALDSDNAGQAGATALIERLGRGRCWLIKTPFKDANECLQKGFDRESFRDIIDAAISLDPKELRNAISYRNAVLARFFPPEGAIRGWETPFDKLSRLDVRFHAGELVIINGVNGHGKTKFASQLTLCLMRQGAKVCIASMEIKPDALLHSMTVQACGSRQPTEAFVEYVQDYYDGRLWMFDVVGTAKAEYLLDVFRYARARYGVTVFCVDSLAKCGIDEDGYNEQKRFVEALCDFKNETDSTVFLITHSRKLDAETRVSDKMDIKGTGAIADLADTVTTLWRNKAKEQRPESERDPDDPDARWYWHKNRNGDYEGICKLWFDQRAYQWLERQGDHARPLVPWVREVETREAGASA